MADELELQLRALAADVQWPPTPDLAAGVLAAEPAPRGRAPRSGRRRLIAALVGALVLVPAAGAVAFPGARDDVLQWLGLRHVSVRRVPRLPPARHALEADLGGLTSLRAASRAAGIAVRVPSVLGPPERVRQTAGRVSLVYAPRAGFPRLPGMDAGLVLTETRGTLEAGFLEKIVSAGTRVERVDVGGRLGAFISGRPHIYLYGTSGGDVVQAHPLLAGPTLVWERDGLVLRLESDATRARAVRVARSVR